VTDNEIAALVTAACKQAVKAALAESPRLRVGTVTSLDWTNTYPTAEVAFDSDPTGSANMGVGILGVQPQEGDRVEVLDMRTKGGLWVLGPVGGVNVQTATTLLTPAIGVAPPDGTPTNRYKIATQVTTDGSGNFTIPLPTPYLFGYTWTWSAQNGFPTQALAASSLSTMAGVLYTATGGPITYDDETTTISWDAEGA
jgi:hypothetical protein